MIKNVIGHHSRILIASIVVSLLVYMASAWRSPVYVHPDEYYQIVEFASHQMGITSADQMAWEFADQIRPAAQPFLCYVLLRIFDGAGVHDHYTQLFLLRALSGLLSLFCVTLLCITALPFIRPQYQRAFILASFFFWYPYTYGVHFSSETWSGCMMMLTISLLVWHYYISDLGRIGIFLTIGALLGLAFLFRFQTAFMSAGLLAWLFFVRRERQVLGYIMVGGLVVLLAGTLADRWLYGQWVFVPWRYFDAAFIHQRADFGTQPVYFFFTQLLLMLTPPVGLLAIVALGFFAYTQRSSIYAWALLPFIILHILIPHKESRFLYPILSFLPLVTFLAWQAWRERQWPQTGLLLSISRWIVIISNTVALVVLVLLTDMRFDYKVFQRQIHQIALSHPVIIYETEKGHSPYILPKATIPRDLYPIYLRDSNITEVVSADLSHLYISGQDTICLVSTDQHEWGQDRNGQVIGQTRPDLSWLRVILSDPLIEELESNNYYLIRL